MKLAKKVLACVVVLAIMSTLAISAFAADASLVLSADKSAAEIGDTITVDLSMSNATGLENLGLFVSYDDAVLELASVASSNDNAIAEQNDAGDVSVGYMNMNSNSNADLALAKMTFKVIAEGNAKITAALITDDNGDADIAVVTVGSTSTSISVTGTEKTTAAPDEPSAAPSDTTAAPDGDDTTKPADEIPATGDAGIAVAAGLVVLAGAAFVASKKRK